MAKKFKEVEYTEDGVTLVLKDENIWNGETFICTVQNLTTWVKLLQEIDRDVNGVMPIAPNQLPLPVPTGPINRGWRPVPLEDPNNPLPLMPYPTGG